MNVYQVLAQSRKNRDYDIERMSLNAKVFRGPTDAARFHQRPFRVAYRYQDEGAEGLWRFSCSGECKALQVACNIGDGSFATAIYWLQTGELP